MLGAFIQHIQHVPVDLLLLIAEYNSRLNGPSNENGVVIKWFIRDETIYDVDDRVFRLNNVFTFKGFSNFCHERLIRLYYYFNMGCLEPL